MTKFINKEYTIASNLPNILFFNIFVIKVGENNIKARASKNKIETFISPIGLL